MRDMDKKALESALGAYLVEEGFRKKASSWYRQAEEALQVVDLQKSTYGLQFYLNLCCVPSGMDVEGMPTPKEHKCPIRIRLTAAFPEQRDEIEEIFDLERTSITDLTRKQRIARLMREKVLPFLDHMKNTVSLRRAIEQGMFTRGAVNLAAQKHLAVMISAAPTSDSSLPT